MKYSSGPWHIGEHQRIISSGWSIRVPSDGSAIAYVLGEKNPELQANARLIAGAPAVLEAAQKLYDLRNLILSNAGAAGYRCATNGEWVCDPWTQAFKDLGEAITKSVGESK